MLVRRIAWQSYRRCLTGDAGTSLKHDYNEELTAEEREEVKKLPFFQKEFEEQSKRSAVKAKQQYIERKIPLTKAIFGEDEQNAGFLSYHLPSSMPSPYYDVYCRRGQSKLADRKISDVKPRLSVTKLLTKRWCELREAYDIYSDIGIFEHPQLLKGIASHQKLEDETHPISEETQIFTETFKVQVPNDEFHKLAGSWFENIFRMMNIFIDGEAREIVCHGYLDSDTGHLRHGPVNNENDILVSAVVDHLLLRKKSSAKNSVPFKLSDSIVSNEQDTERIFEQLRANRAFLKKNFEIIVGDVKTRSFRKVPSHRNVLKATKLQVMYYRCFLEELANDAVSTYSKLLSNAARRGFDVDQPVDPAKVISMMAQSTLLWGDMRSLRDGFPVGFIPFDTFNTGDINYDLSHYSELIGHSKIAEAYGEFLTVWSKPVTLRYLASRLSQVYQEIGALLGNTLMVEYYVGGENFHNTVFDYDYGHLMENCHNSAMFWLGKRDIEPITCNNKNFLTYCKHCDYETVCSWKNIGSKKCLGLGEELVAISHERS